MKNSLEVYYDDNMIYSSNGKWLHPLLQLKTFLDNHDYEIRNILIKDKIIGRAAALIIIFLGIQRCYGEVVSELAIDVLKKHQINFEYGSIVDHIQCKTEDILRDEFDAEKAFNMIMARANK